MDDSCLGAAPDGSQYIFSPLERNDSIRILVIHPGPWESPISCHLREWHPSHSQSTAYEAISYVWGDGQPSKPIYLDGHVLLVRDNLYTILRYMRNVDAQRTIWVDTLCIDQDNIEERNAQVKDMPNIYRRAQRTLVWLKEKEYQDLPVIEALHALERMLSLPAEERIRAMDDFATHLDNTRDINGLAQSFHGLLSVPWFHRVWIVQEFSISPRVLFMCSHDTFSAEAMDQLQDIVLRKTIGNQVCSFYTLYTSIVPLRTLLVLRNDQQHVGHVGFSEVFRITSRGYKATDPRDRVFSLYGLCSPEDVPCSVDYKLGIAEVFQNAVAWCLRSSAVLEDMLALTIQHPVREDWPSWVPDVSVDAPTMTSYVQDHFCAGGSKDTRAVARTDGNVLIIDAGYFLDDVEHIYNLDVPGILELSYQRREAIKNIVIDSQTSYPTGESLAHVFWRLLIADTANGDDPKRAEVGFGDSYLDPRVLDYPFEGEEEAEDSLDDIKLAYLELMAPQELVRLCRTKKGYLGWVCPEVQVGDKMCLFKGFRAPWVLRMRETSRLVGSAYVHGYMYGEALISNEVEWCEVRIS
ncbi:uncharacterized protein PV09_08359 [Verruconis gallopava]|uniref:Heterokaryon incompatibility domain-containing protein n=1 Tax=Verruconis gallopava TaxID=253628 RepID=A0A0D2A159_9PEZI|nr:uncharacterized protein PV09_08359 [Verruconis gallopava]KIW00005.1 hypothetical protein PV09_08359 [Verruconis gallopava]